MLNIASELLAKLNALVLTGQDEDGELEFIGTEEEWRDSELLEIAYKRENG